MITRLFKIIFCLFVFISFVDGIAFAQDVDNLTNNGWSVIESKYCTILCHPDVNINTVNKRVRIRFRLLDRSFYSAKGKTIEEQLAEKCDLLVKRVQTILDMFPRKMHLKVKIFKNQTQLDRAYAETFGHNDGVLRISYYVHKYTTIYTTERVIREGVLAHEIGHAISDHYFLVPPPEKIKELLAQYSELHLED